MKHRTQKSKGIFVSYDDVKWISSSIQATQIWKDTEVSKLRILHKACLHNVLMSD